MTMLNPYRCLIATLAGSLAVSSTIAVHSQDSGRAPAGKEWSTVSGDLGNSRYTTLTQISRETLPRLRGAWRTP